MRQTSSKTRAARWAAVALAGLLCASVITACRPAAPANAPAAQPAAKYHCPMHPTIVSDKKGECPICGMDLVLITPDAPAAAAPAAGGGRRIVGYRSPMDPTVLSDKPAKDSMGMDFVPVYADEAGAGAGAVQGRSAVTLTAERRSLLGIRSEPVRRMRIEKSLRTVGRVTPDERRLAHFHTKFEGYVEHLYVNFTGDVIKKGDPILAIYSPELYATQQEYLLALKAQRQMGSSAIPTVAQGSRDLLVAARERLLQWDIRAEDIAELEKTGRPKRTFDLYSDVTGYVMQKNVVHGMRVMPSDTLLEIADLSHLWVMADVYDSDLASVRLGTVADVTLSSLPGRAWRGTVTYISPILDEKTRTAKVRVEVDNANGLLKPDMFADVLLRNDLGMGLVIPDSAIVDTGDRKLVFIDRPDGSLEPREIQTGARVPAGYQVIRGLAPDDRVVIAASFLLDSESSLRSALAAITGSGAAPAAGRK